MSYIFNFVVVLAQRYANTVDCRRQKMNKKDDSRQERKIYLEPLNKFSGSSALLCSYRQPFVFSSDTRSSVRWIF